MEIIDGGRGSGVPRGAVNNTFYRPRSGFRTGVILRRFPSSAGDLSVKILPKQKKRTTRTRRSPYRAGMGNSRDAPGPPRALGRGIRSPVPGKIAVLALKVSLAADYVAECRAGKMLWVIFAGPYRAQPLSSSSTIFLPSCFFAAEISTILLYNRASFELQTSRRVNPLNGPSVGSR